MQDGDVCESAQMLIQCTHTHTHTQCKLHHQSIYLKDMYLPYLYGNLFIFEDYFQSHRNEPIQKIILVMESFPLHIVEPVEIFYAIINCIGKDLVKQAYYSIQCRNPLQYYSFFDTLCLKTSIKDLPIFQRKSASLLNNSYGQEYIPGVQSRSITLQLKSNVSSLVIWNICKEHLYRNPYPLDV